MKNLHLITGLFILFVFLLTGQYMDFHHPKMDAMGDGTRMMFRSRHIYILLAGLINLALGIYFTAREQSWRQAVQIFGSCLMIAAPFALLGAFFYEPKSAEPLQASLTLLAVVALLAGTLCHSLSGLRHIERAKSACALDVPAVKKKLRAIY